MKPAVSIFCSSCIICLLLCKQILGYSTDDESCPISSSTLVRVLSCPRTETEWNKRARLKNCQSINQTCTSKEKFQYHCVINSDINELLEVCAPVWYSSGYCVEYLEPNYRIQDNYGISCASNRFNNRCPERYISTDAYKYPDCYDLAIDARDKISTKPPPVTLLDIITKQYWNYRDKGVNSSPISFTMETSESTTALGDSCDYMCRSNLFYLLLPVIGILLSTYVFAVLLMIYCVKRYTHVAKSGIQQNIKVEYV